MEEGFQSDFKFIAGIMKALDEMRMKRMIFRISRGRALPSFFDFPHEFEVKPAVKINIKFRSKKNIYDFFPRRS